MAESQAISGMGTLLRVGDGEDPEVFTTLAEVRNINGIAFTADQDDVTHMESPGGVEETVSTIIRTGEINVDANFLGDESTQTTMRDALFDRAKLNVQIIFPFTPTLPWQLRVSVVHFEVGAPSDGRIPLTIRLKPHGIPDFAPA